MIGCDFYIEIYAPQGLNGIEPYLSDCQLPLEPYVSGFNGQVILRYTGNDDTDFAMDPSAQEVMNASGSLATSWAEAWRLLESLSSALCLAGFPHRIGADDPTTKRTFWLTYRCSDSSQTKHEFEL